VSQRKLPPPQGVTYLCIFSYEPQAEGCLIVRQRHRGACRERPKRGQCGHQEDERFSTSGQGPRTVHKLGTATFNRPNRSPTRFKLAFRPRFGLFLLHHGPRSQPSPVNFVCTRLIDPTGLRSGIAGAKLIEFLS